MLCQSNQQAGGRHLDEPAKRRIEHHRQVLSRKYEIHSVSTFIGKANYNSSIYYAQAIWS